MHARAAAVFVFLAAVVCAANAVDTFVATTAPVSVPGFEPHSSFPRASALDTADVCAVEADSAQTCNAANEAECTVLGCCWQSDACVLPVFVATPGAQFDAVDTIEPGADRSNVVYASVHAQGSVLLSPGSNIVLQGDLMHCAQPDPADANTCLEWQSLAVLFRRVAFLDADRRQRVNTAYTGLMRQLEAIAAVVSATSSEVTIDAALDVTGDASVGGNLDVTGDVVVGTLSVGGTSLPQAPQTDIDSDGDAVIQAAGSVVLQAAEAITMQSVSAATLDAPSLSVSGSLSTGASCVGGALSSASGVEVNLLGGATSIAATTAAIANTVLVNIPLWTSVNATCTPDGDCVIGPSPWSAVASASVQLSAASDGCSASN